MKQKLIEIMQANRYAALASTVDNKPNVRLVSYYYDTTNDKIYFSSFKSCDKVNEFAINDKVALTTNVVGDSSPNVRIKSATIRKTDLLMLDVLYMFKDIADTLRQYHEQLLIYEISFSEAFVLVPPAMEYVSVKI